MSINKFNSEGYYDPTAFEAMSAVEKEKEADLACGQDQDAELHAPV